MLDLTLLMRSARLDMARRKELVVKQRSCLNFLPSATKIGSPGTPPYAWLWRQGTSTLVHNIINEDAMYRTRTLLEQHFILWNLVIYESRSMTVLRMVDVASFFISEHASCMSIYSYQALCAGTPSNIPAHHYPQQALYHSL